MWSPTASAAFDSSGRFATSVLGLGAGIAPRGLTRRFASNGSGSAVPPQNHYTVLQVPEHARASEIKAAFYAQAKEHHPDVTAGARGSEARFAQVQLAYEVLGTAASRRDYDLTTRRTPNPPGGPGTSHSAGFSAGMPKPPAAAAAAAAASRRMSSREFKARKAFTVVALLSLLIPVYLVTQATQSRLGGQAGHRANQVDMRGRRIGVRVDNDGADPARQTEPRTSRPECAPPVHRPG